MTRARSFVTTRADRADAWARSLGRLLRAGFALPPAPWDLTDRGWVCVGVVDDEEAVGEAVLAAARGVHVAVVARGAVELLLDDLARVGPVERDAQEAVGGGPVDALPAEVDELLVLLADGASLAEAAAAAHVSLRTAERRLSEARRHLGVRTTAELVARAARRA